MRGIRDIFGDIFDNLLVSFECALVSWWFGTLWCTWVCRARKVEVFLWYTKVFRCTWVYWFTRSEMVDQCLSADAEILGNLSIVPPLGLQLVNGEIELCPVMFCLRHSTS